MIGLHFNGGQRKDRGTFKVTNNLTVGLDMAGIKYRVNPPHGYCEHNGIIQGYGWPWERKINEPGYLWGPNLVVIPEDAPWCFTNQYRHVVACQWVKDQYQRDPLCKADITVWPVGVDTDSYIPSGDKKVRDCLIYYKAATRQRTDEDIFNATEELHKRKQSHTVMRYGDYTDEVFREECHRHRYTLILAGTESQFIALLEMYAMGLPAYILDVNVMRYRQDYTDGGFTTAPYTDGNCGILCKDYSLLDQMIARVGTFNPREYVVDNFTLDKCAKNYYNILTRK